MTNQNEIVLYRPDETLSLEVKLDVERDTVWLSIDQMAELFGRDKSVIGKHVRNVFKEGELRKESVWAKIAYTATDGKTYQVDFYNLDVIISVGYRVKSMRGTQFRMWATGVLHEYVLHGVAIHPSLQQVEYHVTKRLEEQNERLRKIESRQDEQQLQLDFFIRTSTPPAEMVFMHGEFFTARVALEKLIKTAQKRAIIIDSYVDAETFEMLDVRAEGVEAVIYTGGVGKGMTKVRDLHNAQSGREPIEIYKWRVESHDRWLIVDDVLYHCGPSVKDAGRKIGGINRMGTSPEVILNEMR